MLDLSGAHGAAAAANAITSNRFSYSMNLKVGSEGSRDPGIESRIPFLV